MNIQDQFPLTPALLSALAPTQIVSHRTQRSIGAPLSVSLAEFSPADQTIISELYRALSELFNVLEGVREDVGASRSGIRAFTQRVGWSALVKATQQLGRSALDQPLNQRRSAVIHDLRGGSLTALAINIQLLELGMLEANDVLRLFFLTRDHLKMMRNGIYDLDQPRYERDLQQRPHRVQLLVEKWSAASYRLQQQAAEIVVDCRFDGVVSERCIEFAALDRVLYNLINNAVRFTADGRVYLAIFPLEQSQNVRFVVYNQTTEEHRQRLHERFGDDLGQLFRGGFTTGGTGLGMRICAEFVTDAYGVGSVEHGLEQGYVGVQLREGYFVTWAHWPMVAD
jgi:signal transduction histidine kinase